MLMFYFGRFLLDQGVNCTSNVFFVPLNRGVYFARRGVFTLIYVECIIDSVVWRFQPRGALFAWTQQVIYLR